MKDKLVSMAPFFVIIALVLGWGFSQGWFSSKAPSPATTAEAPVAAPVSIQPDGATTDPPITEVVDPALPVEAAPVSVEHDDESISQGWSTYHGDERLAGLSDIQIPAQPIRRWRFQANHAIYHAPVASKSLIHFVTGTGELFAVDFMGVKAWSKQLTRISPADQQVKNARVDSPVSCFNETVVVGTMAGVVHAMDATTGEEKWQTDIDSTILGAVTLQRGEEGHPDRLYVIGQDDGALHCLSMEDGTLLWKGEAIDRCDGSPASGPGIVAFGSCASALHIISAEDGSIQKNISLGDDDQVAGGVALRGDTLYSGSHSGKLFRVDWKSGTVQWTNEDSEDEVFTTPAVSENYVVFGSMDDNVYALDRATGKLQWKFPANGLTTSAVIARDHVIVGADGVLYVIALNSGKVEWSFEVSDEITSPAIIDGMIVVGSDDGTVSAFGAA